MAVTTVTTGARDDARADDTGRPRRARHRRRPRCRRATAARLRHRAGGGRAHDPRSAATPDAVAAAGRVQQRAYRRLGANPEWEADVTASVPAELRAAFDANLAAATIGRRLAAQAAATSTAPTAPTVPTTRSSTLPAWTIRAPKPAAELLGLLPRGRGGHRRTVELPGRHQLHRDPHGADRRRLDCWCRGTDAVPAHDMGGMLPGRRLGRPRRHPGRRRLPRQQRRRRTTWPPRCGATTRTRCTSRW